MPKFEYKVVPAPKKGLKGKGIKGAEERFANALMLVMNDQGAEGWEYLRCDTLPSEMRSGLTGKTTTYQNMLVFRREITALMAEAQECASDLDTTDSTEIETPEGAMDQPEGENTEHTQDVQTDDEDDDDGPEKTDKAAA